MMQEKGKVRHMHAIKAYTGRRTKASVILNLSSRSKQVVSFMFQLLYLLDMWLVGPQSQFAYFEDKNLFPLPEIQPLL
jgi:hypothetical protein